VPYNGLSVVMNTTTDVLMKHPATRALCEALMREVVAGAAAFGRTIGDEFVAQMLDHTDRMVAYAPSMKLDCDARRPMEIDAIYGAPLRAAQERGVKLPRIEMLYQQLSLIQARL
jgi:2-dehydropantoate 2-reductase